MTALAPDHGGAYTALGLPATASRQILLPAALALALAYVERPGRGLLASVAAAGLVLAVVHPTYAIFLWLPFAGFLLVRSLVERREARPIATALAALVVPAAVYLAWLLPVVRDTRSHAPGLRELQRAFRQYAGQLDVFSDTSYRLAPEVFGRAGAVAVAALLFVPLAGLALRSRWAAYVLGGFLAVAAVMLVPHLFVLFSDLASISQSRRAAGFWPLAFAFAGGFVVLAALLRGLVLPAALAGGIALQLLYPGEFAYRLEDGGPAFVTWFAVVGGVAALVSGLSSGNAAVSLERASLAGWAAALFVLPIGIHAAANWSPSDARAASPLTAGLRRRAARERPRTATSSTPTRRRATRSPPACRSTSPSRRRATSPTRRRTGPTSAATRRCASSRPATPRSSAGQAPTGWSSTGSAPASCPHLDSVYRDGRYTLYVVP